MRIFILRHGQAEARAASDEARALTEAGKAEVARVARQLKSRGERVDRMLVSPYRRAQETAKAAAEVLDIARWDDDSSITPDHSPWQAVALCRAHAGENLLFVSHMPFVSRFLMELVGAGGNMAFETGGLVIVEWQPESERGHVVARLSPAESV